MVVLAFAIVLFVFVIIYAIRMSSPIVTQSNGFTGVTTAAINSTLCGALPATATDVRHCSGSVSMGGRLLLYRFSAPLPTLHAHARAEFAAHWDKPTVSSTPASASPLTEKDISQMTASFGANFDWMVPPANAIGTVYISSDGQTSHRPTIFVDATNGVLYFWMTD